MSERFHSIQVRAEDAADVALAIARRFRALGWKVVRDPKGRGAPASSGDPDGLRRFLISASDRGWVTVLPSGVPDSGPDSLIAFLARDLDTIALWMERRPDDTDDERLTYELYWKNKRIDRQDAPEVEAEAAPSPYPTLIDQDLQSLGQFMPSGQKHPKLTVAELPRHYPKYAGNKSHQGRFKRLVIAADYPMLWGSYDFVWNPAAPELERLESWGHLGFQREDGRSAAARLTHGDPAARRGAVESLASCAADEARPGLQAALADDDADVRLAAANVVAARPDPGLVQDLSDRLGDEDVRVRSAAARGLCELGMEQSAEALLEVAFEDEVEVRRSAIAALAKFDTAAALEALVSAARKDKDAEVRRHAAVGMGRAPLSAVAAELVRLLGDKDAAVRAAAARSVSLSRSRDDEATRPLPKLVEALRKLAIREDESGRPDAILALLALLPEDKEARDLQIKLTAANARAGDLSGLTPRLGPTESFPLQETRIATALLRRLEKDPSAEVIVALGNQADPRVLEAIRSVLPRLWENAGGSRSEPAPRAAREAMAEARVEVPYALSRLDGTAAFPTLMKVLELEHSRPAPEDPVEAAADDEHRRRTCFAAMDAILVMVPRLKPAELTKLNDKLSAWAAIGSGLGRVVKGTPPLPAGDVALRRAALSAFGASQPAPVETAADPLVVPVIPAAAKASAKAPPASALPALDPPMLPNKQVLALVRPLLNDIRWPEAALVLARQHGPRSGTALHAALQRSIDKEVRLAKRGGYSRKDAEQVSAHRRGLVLAMRALKDPSAVSTLVRLLTLESLRAGKVERRMETSLLSLAVSTLQEITGYPFGAEPQRWAEVAAGKLPPPLELARRTEKALAGEKRKKATVIQVPKGASKAKKAAPAKSKAGVVRSTSKSPGTPAGKPARVKADRTTPAKGKVAKGKVAKGKAKSKAAKSQAATAVPAKAKRRVRQAGKAGQAKGKAKSRASTSAPKNGKAAAARKPLVKSLVGAVTKAFGRGKAPAKAVGSRQVSGPRRIAAKSARRRA